MSNYEWERGTFKLPSAEFASFRQAIQDADRARNEKAFALTQEFWKGLTRKQQTDLDAYSAAVAAWEAKRHDRPASTGYGSYLRAPDPLDEAALDLANDLLQSKADAYKQIGGGWGNDPGHKPSRVLATEMDYPTNRTTVFRGGEATVSFDKDAKTVTWNVPENNHAVETAHESWLGQAFLRRLGEVRWTHGTGGSLAYHSEFHDEDRSVGGGAARCNGAYGYLGIAENPTHAIPFTNAKGEKITAEVKAGRYGFVGKPVKAGYGQGRVARGVPSGGQFTTRGRGESGVRL